jgi:hypothetical protein
MGNHFYFGVKQATLLVVNSLDRTYELVYTVVRLNVTIQMYLNSLSPTLVRAIGILMMSIV